ncbi:MAG: tRNA-intron lyase [Halobacteriaceae archaeon]
MEGRLRDGTVFVGGDARRRFYDARGYGRPVEEGEARLALTPVEAAHLLYRGDLDAVVDGDHRLQFRGFLARVGGLDTRVPVYADLRDRGFYLSPDREGWAPTAGDADFVVYPRGEGPDDGTVKYRVDAVGERRSVPATRLDGRVLAVVDEESEVTYFDTDRRDPSGGTTYRPSGRVQGSLLDERVLVPDPPEGLYGHGFYGQPLADRDDGAVQLSLVEAAHLATEGVLAVEGADGSPADDGTESPQAGAPDGGDDASDEPLGDVGDGEDAAGSAVLRLGRMLEGDRFDRRLVAYRTLRGRGLVPKTGFKFGADFRVYGTVESVTDLPHAEALVRVVPGDHEFDLRSLALDVRLAHGVRKQMLFARVAANGDTDWLAASRLTP